MNDLSASSRITYPVALVQPGAARRIRGLSDKSLAWLFITPTIVLLLAINRLQRWSEVRTGRL